MSRTFIFLFAGCSAIFTPLCAQHLPGNSSGAGTGLNITDHMLNQGFPKGIGGRD